MSAIGTSVISFGLVNIPVKVYSSNDSSGKVSFRQLHGKCKNLMNTQHYCKECQEVVPKEDQLKATQVGGDNWVVFTEDDLKVAAQTTSPVIDISEFVLMASVDPVYFERMNYLSPDKAGVRGYWLLHRALTKTKRCGVGQFTNRGKAHPVLVRAIKGGLAIQVLRYQAEIHDIDTVDIPIAASISKKEVELAIKLVESRSGKFDPSKHVDPVQTVLNNMIKKKVADGELVSSVPQAAPPVAPTDLTAALKASLTD